MRLVARECVAVLLLGALLIGGCGRTANGGSAVPSGTGRSSAAPSPTTVIASVAPSVVPSAAPLTKDEAIIAARGFAGVSPSATVDSAEAGPFGQFEPDRNDKVSQPPADHWVWDVQFRDAGTNIVAGAIIDYVTGALVDIYLGIPN
jgi:hypothetical protein